MADGIENGSIAKVTAREQDAGAAFVLESKGLPLLRIIFNVITVINLLLEIYVC